MDVGAAQPNWIDRLLGEVPRPGTIDAETLAKRDRPLPPGPDGWTPQSLTIVKSREHEGILRSQLRYAVSPIEDLPGQRLSTAQIDEIAPYMAATFGVDEQFVRSELAKVYVYVGGPAADMPRTAVTVGHHVYVPEEQSFRDILSPGYKRWLVHELGHTMQFLTYSKGNIYHSSANYLRGFFMGTNPERPGVGSGPPIWGALFTGQRLYNAPQTKPGDPASTEGERMLFGVQAPATVAVPAGLVAGGALEATRRFLSGGGKIPHPAMSFATGLAAVAVPGMVGSAAGAFGAQVGIPATIAGAGAGAASAWLGLRALRLFGAGDGGVSKLVMLGGVLAGAVVGGLGGQTTSRTLDGWSKSSRIIREHKGDFTPRDFADAMHEAHWLEVDAEAAAQQYTAAQGTDWTKLARQYRGVIPSQHETFGTKADFAVVLPTIVGVPAAAAAGTGVLLLRAIGLGTRPGGGGGLLSIMRSGVSQAAANRGLINTYSVGAAATLAPLLIGGIAGTVADDVTGSKALSKMIGTGAAAAGAGMLTAMLLRGRSSSLPGFAARIALGAAIGGAFGLVSASAAVNAKHESGRRYVPAPRPLVPGSVRPE